MEDLPIPAEDIPEEAEAGLSFETEPVDADPQAGSDILPAPVEAPDAEEEALETPENPAEGETDGAGESDAGDGEAVIALENGTEEALSEDGSAESEAPPDEANDNSVANAGVPINADSFPDERLRAYVSGEYDTDGDGALSDAEPGRLRVRHQRRRQGVLAAGT